MNLVTSLGVSPQVMGGLGWASLAVQLAATQASSSGWVSLPPTLKHNMKYSSWYGPAMRCD